MPFRVSMSRGRPAPANVVWLAGLSVLGSPGGHAAPPFTVADRIPLGNVIGRLDHLATDLRGGRLFVAELGNDSVAVIDPRAGRVVQRLSPIREPQGVAYSASADTLAVASGGEGRVRLFGGDPLAPGAVIDGLADADNLRLDAATGRLLVGHGGGALTVLELPRGNRHESFRLPGHPESFQLETRGGRAFINVPAVAAIIVLPRESPQRAVRWELPGVHGNFAMALDEPHGLLWTLSRQPARVTVVSTSSGAVVAQLPACGDADDVFVDEARQQTYVICGEGLVQVIGWGAGKLCETARFATSPGARTGLFVPEWNALFVAAPARRGSPAMIWRLVPAGKDARACPPGG